MDDRWELSGQIADRINQAVDDFIKLRGAGKVDAMQVLVGMLMMVTAFVGMIPEPHPPSINSLDAAIDLVLMQAPTLVRTDG